jgi:hypothetical protein
MAIITFFLLGVIGKTAKRDCYLRHVRPSVCPHGIARLPQHGVLQNLIFEHFSKYVEKIQAWLTFDKNVEYFIWKRMHIYNNISLNSSQNDKRFGQNL